MDRLRHLTFPLLLLSLLACEDNKPSGPAPGRFAAVKSAPAEGALRSFCEKAYPGQGDGTRKYAPPPERPIPGAAPTTSGQGWRWVNLWATWCLPCMEELPLLQKWKDTLAKDGINLQVDLVSVDEDQAELTKALQKPMPGRVTWMRAVADLPVFLDSVGVDKGSPIPVHVLVDPAGNLRCVRVGSVHEGDFGTVKSILSGA
ncbi:MAG: TlpA disulfide reductase family protein [Myxococcota bacterium]